MSDSPLLICRINLNKNETFLDRFKEIPLPRLLVFEKQETHPKAILEDLHNRQRIKQFLESNVDSYIE